MPYETYIFRPLNSADLPRLRRWLSQPHVRAWWGDPDKELALIAADIDEPKTTMRIVAHEGREFAYAQDYEVHDWPQSHLADLQQGTRAVDTFIGETDMLGKGHGAGYLRQLAGMLCRDGAPMVTIDPDPPNMTGRHAFKKAGFRGDRIVMTDEGRPAIVMKFVPESAEQMAEPT